MKYRLTILFFSLLIIGCKTQENVPVKENPPTVFTKAASDVTLFSATLNGEVTDEGFSASFDRGFVYSDKNTNPSLNDSKLQSFYGKGVYSILVDKLTLNTKYYFKAYATNTKGTAYGEVQSFTTSDYKLPTAVTDVPKNITYTTVELAGSVTDEGGGAVSESGFVVGTNASPTITDLKFPVARGKASIALIVSKLNLNTKYYVRSYAINEKGLAYGNEQSFTTADCKLSTVVTEVPKNIGYSSVEINGSVADEGGGIVSENGFVYGLLTLPTINDNKVPLSKGKGVLNLWINKLKSSTKYFVRSYAINEKGTAYGNEQSFTTLNVTTVTSKTGRVWMDRNLGASQVATSQTDEKAYGDLYQWGRPTDGHQIITSANTSTLSSTDLPPNGLFILKYSLPNDWRSPQNNNLWQGVNGINNVCPTGFRIPTEEEWNLELLSWSGKNNTDAFTSPLKLTMAGYRNGGSNGPIDPRGYSAMYWSSTTESATISNILVYRSRFFGFDNYPNNAGMRYNNRSDGGSIRCIKD